MHGMQDIIVLLWFLVAFQSNKPVYSYVEFHEYVYNIPPQVKKKSFFESMLYDDVRMDQINSQEYKSFEMHVVTIARLYFM